MGIFSMNWDLETFFKKKGTGEDFTLFINDIKTKIQLLTTEPFTIAKKISLLQTILKEHAEAEAFIHCLLADDTTSEHTIILESMLRLLHASIENLSMRIHEELRCMDESTFNTLLQDPLCQGNAFTLNESRLLAKDYLPLATETLITDLSIDGYHGYSQLFYTLHSHLRFTLKEKNTEVSFAQLENLMHDSCRKARIEAFKSYQEVFSAYTPHFAQVLNHIAGFRLQVYQKRGWESPLYEPLISNRMNEKTLSTMWKVINKYTSRFTKYLEKKASIFGLKKLSWHDVETPLYPSTASIPYENACQLIIKQLEKYSPQMALFAEKALKENWVEAENRKNKGAGGFCVGFPLKNQSRIFMTYSGTPSNVSTLAHELGHAYHNEIIFTHPYLSQNIKMNVAETASTMAELIVSDACLKNASSKEEKLAVLDDKISSSIAFFINIQARFLFETAFYKEKMQGYVSGQRLCELMEKAQKEAYQNTLEEWNPLFWASKMHFYFTDVPFYNFPYTFGYLFSSGVYSLLTQDPASFEKRYNALLFDTPLMSSEALAQKHFEMNLEEETFWEMAMKEPLKDLDLFFDLIS